MLIDIKQHFFCLIKFVRNTFHNFNLHKPIVKKNHRFCVIHMDYIFFSYKINDIT